ncbi:cobalt-precorrin-6A reductase [Hansschlegelia plantiphila]|uniref:cobalt-precorrin-6A reductase n=1 Tax=Hansschlegelia plantiphila TaxID=374655 RepID=UPI0022F2782C|nr:cobalt-precorrin-6A reductase [Hansschlegelia plantiphila]
MTAAAAAPSAGPRILVLGGSTEGFAAAEALANLGYDVVSSFAGRTRRRRHAAGAERIGGFGGVDGLAAYLAVEDVALVVDALHPFAATMKANAAAACAEVGAPLIHIDRPQWAQDPRDDWRLAPDVATAAAMTPATGGVCFLTIGRQQIDCFEKRTDLDLLIRVIDPPERPFRHPRASFLCARGPFRLDAERALFEERGITCLVTKNSGSAAAEAKLMVARELGLPVVIVDRPPPPGGQAFASVEEAVAAAAALLGDETAW